MGLTAHGLYSLKLHAFKLEEKLLCGKAATIACKASVATYDAVAGSEDRNGVRAVGCAYRPYCLRVTNHLGHPAIAPGLPVRDFQQGVPDFFLKLGADEQKGQIECLASSGKIFIELLCGLCGDLRWGCLSFPHSGSVPIVCPPAAYALPPSSRKGRVCPRTTRAAGHRTVNDMSVC